MTTARWLLALIVCSGLAASAEPAGAASVGAILGLDRCSISGDAPANTEYGGGTGLIAGVQGEIALTRGIALSLQPMFNQRRTSVTAADSVNTSGERSVDLELDYVSLPVVVKFASAGGRTYAAGGVDIGFLTSARVSGDGVDEDVESSFKSVDVGALLGFGVVFPIGRPSLTTELRYVQGLVNLSGDADASAIRDLPDRFHSNGWQLMAGILLPLGTP